MQNQIAHKHVFRHLGHVGYTPEKGFSIQNNDPEWDGLFEQLQSLGIPAEEIHDNKDFIKNFVTQRTGGLPPPTPARPNAAAAAATANGGIKTSRPPPPPPPARRAAPPPPPIGGKSFNYSDYWTAN